MSDKFNVEEIRKGIAALLTPGRLYELRALEYTDEKHRAPSVAAGWFDDFSVMEAWIKRLSGRCLGVYATLNPVLPKGDLPNATWQILRTNIARCPQPHTTSNYQIAWRDWLYIDLDPVRPTNPKCCSTDAEKEAARATASEVQGFLAGLGWPEGVVLDSGSGYGLRYRISLPNDGESEKMVNACIRALAERFSTDVLEIDRKVGNAARIARFPGTLNCKGTNTPERPHRMSLVVSNGASGTVTVSREQLVALAAMASPKARKTATGTGEGTSTGDELGELLAKWKNVETRFEFSPAVVRDGDERESVYNIRCAGTLHGWPDGTKHSYKGGDQAQVWVKDGKFCFRCLHQPGCDDDDKEKKKTFHDLWAYFGRLVSGKEEEPEETCVPSSPMGEPEEMPMPEDATPETTPGPTRETASVEAAGEKRGPESDPLLFPEDALYGKLGKMARDMLMPLGLAYPALLACHSVRPTYDRMLGARVNLYVALIDAPRGGKNEAISRALALSRLVFKADYTKFSAGGDTQLCIKLGDTARTTERGKRTGQRSPGPKKLLVVNGEMSEVLVKTGMEHSTLASRLCEFWDDNLYEKMVGRELITIDCRLSWLGGIPATVEKPERFSEMFGAESNYGLYDRFILGYNGTKWQHEDWECPHEETGMPDRDLESAIAAVDLESEIAAMAKTVARVDEYAPEAWAAYEGWHPTMSDDI